jgi:Mor family transcriptional regulator
MTTTAAERDQRNLEIFKAWRDGVDERELARKHHLTLTRVRQICRAEQARRRRKRRTKRSR